MAKTLAAICPTCNGWVLIISEPSDAERARLTKAAEAVSGVVRAVAPEDIRSLAIPACKCCRGASEQDPLFGDDL